jgi:uncharacterized membrane protein YgdD (TMEM256/DUF423 family)
MTIVHGALQAFLAVLAGAFGAHGLQKVLDEYGLRIWQTGVTYHMTHALALVLLGILERQLGIRMNLPHFSFGLGILLFSGSLYLLALSGVKWLGAITPLGGTAFLVGWLALAYAAWKAS